MKNNSAMEDHWSNNPRFKAEQEPVAVVDANDDGYWAEILPDRNVKVGQFLYTTPPQRKPLTDDQIETLWHEDANCNVPADLNEFRHSVKVAEAAHGIKE